METKKCYKCKIEKPIIDFYNNRRANDGLDTRCNKKIFLNAIKYLNL